MIYFAQAASGGPIKIGTTIDLVNRLNSLSCEAGCRLEVLAVLDGNRDAEQRLHQRFSHLRRVGEWFEPGDDLIRFILSKGRSWNGGRGHNGSTVKISRSTASKAKAVANHLGVTIAEVMTDAARPAIDRAYAKMLRDLEASDHA